MSRARLTVTVRAVLADPWITVKELAYATGMTLDTARRHRMQALEIIAEVRGEPPPRSPRKPYTKKNPLKP